MSDATRELRVVVVDDEPGMCLGATRALEGVRLDLPDLGESAALRVATCASGEEFLAGLPGLAPDIVLLDCMLPGKGGMEVLELVSGPSCPFLVVMITAYATLETAVRATKLGAYDFLAKPFTPDELRAAVRKAGRDVLLTRKARALEEERRLVRFNFVSVLAHELKSPLAAVEGYLDIMRRRLKGESLAGYDPMVGRSLERIHGMRKLVLDLLDLTAIESGRKKRSLGRVDLASVAEAALEAAGPAAAARGIALAFAAAARPVVEGDRGELDMILGNLVSNAVKYNRAGGRVDLALRAEGELAVLDVADTGIGISPEEAGRLFEEFARIKKEETRDIGGSGLGLSIVRRLARLHGGDVTLASEPGRGSTFTLRLPATRDADGSTLTTGGTT